MMLGVTMQLTDIRRLVRALYIRSHEYARVALEQEDGTQWQNDKSKEATNKLTRRLVDTVGGLVSELQSLVIDDELRREFELGG